MQHMVTGDRWKLRFVRSALSAPVTTTTQTMDPATATTTTDMSISTNATVSSPHKEKKRSHSTSSDVPGKQKKLPSGQGRKRVGNVTGSVITTTTTAATPAPAAHATIAQPYTISCGVFVWNDGSEFIPDSPAFDMTNAGIQPAFQVQADQDYVDYFLAFLDVSNSIPRSCYR